MGDINCEYRDSNNHQDIKRLFTNNGFKQLINKPTRITENSSSLLDVILTNSPEKIVRNNVLLCDLGDHEMIGAIRKQSQQKYQPKTIRSINFKNYNAEIVRNEVINTNLRAFVYV